MSVEENKAIARRWHKEVFNEKNLDAIDELLDANYINYAIDIHGLAAAKEELTKIISDSPDCHITAEDMIAEGDKVAMRWTWRAGGKVTSGITILRIAGGKIVEDWFCGREMPEGSEW